MCWVQLNILFIFIFELFSILWQISLWYLDLWSKNFTCLVLFSFLSLKENTTYIYPNKNLHSYVRYIFKYITFYKHCKLHVLFFNLFASLFVRHLGLQFLLVFFYFYSLWNRWYKYLNIDSVVFKYWFNYSGNVLSYVVK